MKIRTTIRMTNQEKFIHYFEENLKEDDKRRVTYNKAVDTWKDIHKCDPPYSNYDSFKVALSKFRKDHKVNKDN